MTELEQDLPSSDESDEDFVPSGEDNLPSEEDSNSEDEEEQTEGGTNKRSKHSNKSKKRKRQEATIESIEESKDTKNEKPKLSTEDLWKEFISNPKDSKPEKAEESTLTPEVKTVTQVFKFAGEQVKVEKQIPVSSRGRGRGRGGGLSGILGTLGKQPKLSILDKSKLDWNQYKQAEGLEEELSTFNKGKDGYLEKQDFLQRTDLRQFEKEKELRNATRKTLNEIIKGLEIIHDQIREVLQMDKVVQQLAKEMYEQKSMLLMGRGYNYATCMEGALKIKELTYMHSEGIMAGELKHGPLALIDNAMPVIMILTRDPVYIKCMNALLQVIARDGRPIVICEKGDEETQALASKTLEVPHTVDCLQGILTVIPMQLLSYHIAVLKGCNVDCPRNLAKSVTVE